MYRNVSLKLFDKSQIFNSSHNHLFNRLFKFLVLLRAAFLRTFYSAARHADLLRLVARIQKRIYVVGSVYQPVLIERARSAGKAHRRESVVLSDYNVPAFEEVYYPEVDAVSAL